MTRCFDCRNRRWLARSSGVGMWSMFRICYQCWNRRNGRLHIAGRIALVSIGTAFVVCVVLAGVAGWYSKVAWELGHLVGR